MKLAPTRMSTPSPRKRGEGWGEGFGARFAATLTPTLSRERERKPSRFR
jgi:hypothetical protein